MGPRTLPALSNARKWQKWTNSPVPPHGLMDRRYSDWHWNYRIRIWSSIFVQNWSRQVTVILILLTSCDGERSPQAVCDLVHCIVRNVATMPNISNNFTHRLNINSNMEWSSFPSCALYFLDKLSTSLIPRVHPQAHSRAEFSWKEWINICKNIHDNHLQMVVGSGEFFVQIYIFPRLSCNILISHVCVLACSLCCICACKCNVCLNYLLV